MAPKKATKKAAKAKSPEEATCPVCSKKFFEGGCHPESQKLWIKLWQHMAYCLWQHVDPQTIMAPKKATPKKATPKKATKKAAEAKSPEKATCPVCSKKFSKGGCHPASQKLWQHMGHTDNLHLEAREKMRWNKRGWNGPGVSG